MESSLALESMLAALESSLEADVAPVAAAVAAPLEAAALQAPVAAAALQAPLEAAALQAPAAEPDQTDHIFDCPHCAQPIQVPKNGVNCQIFRHGAFRHNPDIQIPPHAPREICEQLVADNMIFGCGKPFRFDGVTATICDYV